MDPFALNSLSGVGGLGGSTTLGMPSLTGDLATQRASGLTGVQGASGVDSSMSGMMAMQTQMLAMLLQILMMLMKGGGLGAASGTSPSGVGGVGGVGGTGSGSGGGGGTSNAGSVGQTGSSAATDSGSNQVNSGIGPGTKVLEIGDSHSVGVYGQELEKLLEGKGAKVDRQAAVGTSARHWINGTSGAGKLQNLIAKDKPDVVIINLGANSRGGVGSDVKRLAQIAKSGGAQVIWVGPPRTRADMSNPASLKKFDDQMRAQLQGLGTYVSSAPFTSYSGPDGIHYNATPARKWAQGVFNAIT